MKIIDLKLGSKIKCPEDRGNKSYYGVIDFIGEDINYTLNDIPYVWVTIINPNDSKSIWPSNRITIN